MVTRSRKPSRTSCSYEQQIGFFFLRESSDLILPNFDLCSWTSAPSVRLSVDLQSEREIRCCHASLSGRWQGDMCSRPEWPPPPRASAHALLASPVASLRHGRRRELHLHQTPAALGRLPAVPFRVGQARYGRAAAPSPPSPRVPSSARLLDSFFLFGCPIPDYLAVPADSACPVVEVAEDDSVVCSLVAPPACGGGGEEVAWCEIKRNAGDASSATIRNLRCSIPACADCVDAVFVFLRIL